MDDPPVVPALVSLHVWRISRGGAPRALVRMALDRPALRHTPGLRFAKLLGTGRGRTFTPGDADFAHWALLTSWSSAEAAAAFEQSSLAQSWQRLARERLHVTMHVLSSRGEWSRTTPFGNPTPRQHDGAVAALTRARLAPSKALAFWRSVPPVSADLHESAGLRLALGIGEAPVGVQGTFSLWESEDALTDFAYRRNPHRAVVVRTPQVKWYAEQLFARLAVVSVDGTYNGSAP